MGSRGRAGDDFRELLISSYLSVAGVWDGQNHWTWGVVETLIADAPEIAWPILLEIIERAPEDLLAYIAAGPLESLLMKHGFRVIDAIEEEAGRNPKFRRTLAGVWFTRGAAELVTRLGAIVDDQERAALDAQEPRGARTTFEWRVAGDPPTISGSSDAVQAARRDALLEATQAIVPPEFQPWATPVYLNLRRESGPIGDATASPVDALAAIAETLARDRSRGLADARFDGFGLIEQRAQVREANIIDVFSHEPAYILRLTLMVPDQVAVISDPRAFDQLDAVPTLEADFREIEQLMLEHGMEVPEDIREMFENLGFGPPKQIP